VRVLTPGLSVERFFDRLAVAYLGDDRTDEDAFAALQRIGLAVLVRSLPQPTAANLWIEPPEELVEFLAQWRQAQSRLA
jgi:trehalose-6-phosphatase